LRFEWDDAKAAANRRKHGVSFEEARTVFDDPNRLEIFDLEHSKTEDRWLVIGRSEVGRVLTTVYVLREEDVYRIIMARNATVAEVKRYESRE
jgi:hypothetical protein